MTDNKRFWNKFNRPPKEALKTISGGNLNGMTDINPIWRTQAMTEVFGPKGIGWYDEIVDRDVFDGAPIVEKTTGAVIGKERIASVRIKLYIKEGDAWSAPIEGVGGSKLVVYNKNGFQSNDEAFKMAYTDAQSVAMKALGIAADIYYGLWDGSKYKSEGIADVVKPDAPKAPAAPAAPAPAPSAPAQTGVAPSPVDNYRKHFLKVLQENKRVGSEPGKVDIIGLGKYCLKNYGAGMDGLNIDQMKSTLNMLKGKGHIPANTEV